MYYWSPRRNPPVRVKLQNPPEGPLDNYSGGIAAMGYERLSHADRETGERPSVGDVEPVMPACRSSQE